MTIKFNKYGTVRVFTFPIRIFRLSHGKRELRVDTQCHYDCPHVGASVRPNATTCHDAPTVVQLCSDTHTWMRRDIDAMPRVESKWKCILTLLWRFIRVLNTPITYQSTNLLYISNICKEYKHLFSLQRNQTQQLHWRIIFERREYINLILI